MGLRDTVQNAAKTAISAVGDIAKSVTYVSMSKQSAYDPSSGDVWLEGTSYSDVSVIFAEFSAKEIDGEKIRATDEKALIAAKGFTPTPKIGDRIHKSSTDHWQVMDKDVDPAGALWVLQMRKVAVRDVVAPP